MDANNKSKKVSKSLENSDLKIFFSNKDSMKGAASESFAPLFDFIHKIPLFSDELIFDLQESLKIKIKNPDIFKLALLHRSTIPYLQKKFGQDEDFSLLNNERLEFLGDSVFNFIISEHLFVNNFSKDEGVLSSTRAKLINRPILGEVARKLRLDEFIQTSYNARALIEAGNLTILSNGLEAIVGAVLLDSGFEKTKQFVLKILLPLLEESNSHDSSNYKSTLMEYVQSFGKAYPKYQVLGDEGPDHQKLFLVGVYVENKLLGTGLAGTKKEAEQIAAKKVLELSANLL